MLNKYFFSMPRQFLNKHLFKLIAVYLVVILTIFSAIWALMGRIFPNFEVNLINTLSTAFNIAIPESVLQGPIPVGTVIVLILITFLSILLIITHIYFEAILTARVIHPKVDIFTANRGVLSDKWGGDDDDEHILVRMVNFHKGKLVDVNIRAVITVWELLDIGDGKTDEFLCYFPVPEVDPNNILVLTERTPWSIAIPNNIILKNSINENYLLELGRPIKKSFAGNNKVLKAKRTLEILISGVEPVASSPFTFSRSIDLDTQDGDEYILYLHKGQYVPLPMYVQDKESIEKFC